MALLFVGCFIIIYKFIYVQNEDNTEEKVGLQESTSM